MTEFIAIDPGTEESALLTFDPARESPILEAEILPNLYALDRIRESRTPIVCEMVSSYGMPVGRDVFETVLWTGRFIEAAIEFDLVYRKDVKLHICNSTRANDANIRQALLDLFPRTGGGKTPQVGTKGQPGPLYGIKTHLWAALAVAVCWSGFHGVER